MCGATERRRGPLGPSWEVIISRALAFPDRGGQPDRAPAAPATAEKATQPSRSKELARPDNRPPLDVRYAAKHAARSTGRAMWRTIASSPRVILRTIKHTGQGVAATTTATVEFVRHQEGKDNAALERKKGNGNTANRIERRHRWIFWSRVGAALGLYGGAPIATHQALVANNVLPDPYAWMSIGAAAAGIFAYIGWRKEGRPPVLADTVMARERGDITKETIDEALRSVKILAKPTKSKPHPDGVKISALPRAVDGGMEYQFDLPSSCGKSVKDVQRQAERLAAAFAVPLPQFHVDRGDNPAQVRLWVTDNDPFDQNRPTTHPLLDVERWSVFEKAPAGQNARRREVRVPLVYTHWMVGGLPDRGKTSWMRSIVAAALLDPHVVLHVFDGKRGKDWAALRDVATTYEAGPIPEQCRALLKLLNTLMDEGDRRFEAMKHMSDEECPDSKLTRAMHENGMPYHLVIIDESHNHYLDEEYGEAIVEAQIRYQRGYRAAGLGIISATQRIGSELGDMFTALRGVTGSRLAVATDDWQSSNMILGDRMNTRGYDASDILPNQRGTGILRGDLDADGRVDSFAQFARSHYMTNAEWSALCEHAAELRKALAEHTARTEPDVEDDDEQLPASDLVERIRLNEPTAVPVDILEGDDAARRLGEFLSRAGVSSTKVGGGQRVRSRAAVEAALDLPNGSLKARPQAATPPAPPQPVGPSGQYRGTPLGGSPGAPRGRGHRHAYRRTDA